MQRTKVFLTALLLSIVTAHMAFAAAAQITALPYDREGRPIQQVFTTCVDTAGVACSAAGTDAVAQASTTSGESGTLVQCATTTSAPTYTTAKTNPISCDTAGSTRVTNTTAIPAGTNVIGHVIVDTTSTTAVTQATAASLNATVIGTGTFAVQASSTLQTQTDTVMVGGVNIKEINAVTPLMGNGVTGTGSQRVTIASDNTAFNVKSSPTATTTGGASGYSLAVAASDNHANIKDGAGTVYQIDGTSIHTAYQNVRLYDLGTGFNGCGSATGLLWSGLLPGASTGAGFVIPLGGAVGLAFTTGLSICVSGAIGNTDTTSATASVARINVQYK